MAKAWLLIAAATPGGVQNFANVHHIRFMHDMQHDGYPWLLNAAAIYQTYWRHHEGKLFFLIMCMLA
jgi:hypothetical protein